ncbi:hypothetical protein M422DRAFT_30407 [Sphaerobolus stellatus SS14]|uniref:Large ribosomal subunit protein mL54 n=1 Tax=Sphaerobolus stellatus (strain SS14) TaxID=990650 RepID=A0A0C9W046_SPHS4|nr:hypothetical protein M422DRAFT_30407 [Sphaerobolus stellatus SS14]
MSLLVLRQCLTRPVRYFSTAALLRDVVKDATKDADAEPLVVSSCPANTVLEGLSYLKDQPPVVALPDEEYPAWLWTVLTPKHFPEDGPGGKAEKVRLRKENKQKIKDQNFMKTQ